MLVFGDLGKTEIMQEVLNQLSKELRQKFESARARFSHNGNKGSNAEAIVRDFLKAYLPARYGVGHGEVVDSDGHRSAQTDIVITTDEHPYSFSSDQPGLFFIEGVFAVCEVKSVLTSQDLERTIANARKFRTLNYAPGGLVMNLQIPNESDFRRYCGKPPYFVFAFESQLSMEFILQKLRGEADRSIDALFILDGEASIDLGDGKGLFRLEKVDGSVISPISGWLTIPGANTLALLLLWLSGMPSPRYSRSILSKYLLGAIPPFRADGLPSSNGS